MSVYVKTHGSTRNFETSPRPTRAQPTSIGSRGDAAHVSAEAAEEHRQLASSREPVAMAATTGLAPTLPGAFPGAHGPQASLPDSPHALTGGLAPATKSPTSVKALNQKKGAHAVSLARKQLGKPSADVRMPNYTHAGGVTNNCADFVSGVLANAGMFKKNYQDGYSRDANVTNFRNDLQHQGWKPVSKAKTQPGDVAIILGDLGGQDIQHTELVASKRATTNIGSNGTSVETVGTDNLDWANGIVTYYAPPGGG